LNGTFKTGKAIPGTFSIRVRKTGYYDKTITANFINGEVLTPRVELVRLPIYSITGKVVYPGGAGVSFANVSLVGSEGTYNINTDANGLFQLTGVSEGLYQMQAGIWGHMVQADLMVDAPKSLTLQVIQGYYDDFDLDFNWDVSGDATEGVWARGIPTAQTLFNQWLCGSPTDSPFDIGSNVFSTGLSSDDQASVDEVSGGTTILATPPMNLDSILVPTVFFDYWLCEYPPNEYHGFSAWWTNSEDTVLIEQFENNNTTGFWQRYSTQLEINGPKDEIRILFIAEDTTIGTGDYYLKVHVDNFSITEGANGTHDEWLTSKHFLIYPNPVEGDQLYLKPQNGIEGELITISFCDIHGRILATDQITKTEAEHGIHHKLNNGIYFMQWQTELGESGVEKVLVIKK
jgi:hypothetical protein